MGQFSVAAAWPAARCQEFELHFDYLVSGDGMVFFGVKRSRSNAKNADGVYGENFNLPSTNAAKNVWKNAVVQVQDKTITYNFFDGDKNETRSQRLDFHPDYPAWSIRDDATVSLKNVKIKPLAMKSLFNGKDLAGWKEFPGKKSKFTVTDKGEINIKDGPGDLQTDGKYGDFVLQLECISNGKHLNSGVFFRCRPGEYQNGYEAQIRNQFTPEAIQDYTLEEYDPKTNKLTDKKEVKYTAVDYGTGAIYRRQPARKEVAKDGEWFTMTIVAHGNHFATWVNGIQVTDWTDNRPKSDNARTGCRLEAGHISLQGHDPTTDLSFRNFRIAELK